MIIYDWDDTIQKNLNPGSSIGMFLKTLLYPCNEDMVNKAILEDNMIITARARLYTFAIKLKCFMITKSLKSFQDRKITTINPDFFFDKFTKEYIHEDLQEHLKVVTELKISLAKIYQKFGNKRDIKNFTYVDLDILDSKREKHGKD